MRQRKNYTIEDHALVELLSPALLVVALIVCVIVSERFPAGQRAGWGIALYGVSAIIILSLMGRLNRWLKRRNL